jgi:hypothetical protein
MKLITRGTAAWRGEFQKRLPGLRMAAETGQACRPD